ncbi:MULTISPECIES: hypothetical protein [unclassified Streptomyces]|uniref:hypothetical protein n=1 Tax=unclassified Streptomyces TaxID=2593676 RepID=UPI00109E36E6|nr:MULTISPECIES: hypothetical protein [unclassified Streptomyces]THC53395.1 hypothetical protein E7X58_09220 [Streptomyces sp. A1499]
MSCEPADPDDPPGVYGVIVHDEAGTHRSADDLGADAELFRQAVACQVLADATRAPSPPPWRRRRTSRWPCAGRSRRGTC